MKKLVSSLGVVFIFVFFLSFQVNSDFENADSSKPIDINIAVAGDICGSPAICKENGSCYPKLGFACNTMGTGNDCSMYYNCQIQE